MLVCIVIPAVEVTQVSWYALSYHTGADFWPVEDAKSEPSAAGF